MQGAEWLPCGKFRPSRRDFVEETGGWEANQPYPVVDFGDVDCSIWVLVLIPESLTVLDGADDHHGF